MLLLSSLLRKVLRGLSLGLRFSLCLCATGFTVMSSATAQAPIVATVEPTHARPKVALVLSGGGARGLAHVGVLRTLQELRVPVDLVVGTSMGALVGGAFASGRSVDELESFAKRADWEAILADRPPRRDFSFSRREEDQRLSSRVEFGLNGSGLQLPPAAAGNGGLELALDRLTPGSMGLRPLNQLPLPFQALATDLVSGRLITLSDTPLNLAMRASMAVPGLFTPVRIKGRLVADGGLVRNLGVDVARAMGADVVIAVNVGSPLLDEKDIQSALSVTDQMIKILTTQNVERSLAELRESDVLIDPDIDSTGLTDFELSAKVIESGRLASLAAKDRLQALSLSAEDYARHESQRRGNTATQTPDLPLGSLRIVGAHRSNPEALKNELQLQAGEPVGIAQIQAAKAQLHGRGGFDTVDAEINDAEGKRDVTLTVSEANWTHSRLRLGFEVASDFNTESRYTLSGMHTLSWLNRWGAQLRTVARIGWQRELGLSFMQPLGAGSPWYLEPSVDYSGYKVQAIVEDIESSSVFSSLALGRRLGDWGDIQIAMTRRSTQFKETFRLKDRRAGSSWDALKRTPFELTQQVRWRVDTLDALSFPERGALIDLTLGLSSARKRNAEPLNPSLTASPNKALNSADKLSLGDAHRPIAQPDPDKPQSFIRAKLMQAFRFGDWAGHAFADFAQGTENYPISAEFGLGRFLRLSGSAAPTGSSVLSYRFGRLVMAKRLGQMPVGLGGAVRAGFSLESGAEVPNPNANSLIDTGSITRRMTRYAGSGFFTIDTRLGPVYLGAGSTRDGDSSFYFYIGPVW